MTNTINLVKLCVGIDSLEHLETWRASRRKPGDTTPIQHVTRMWPKRETELLNGGSLYWVIKGVILARQRVLSLDEVIGQDGIRRCAIVMDNELIRTEAAPRRAFQGWRYLKPEDAPADLGQSRTHEDTLPNALTAALAEIGVR
ncbi:DUF1489 family protein [Cochlodiniinecator piscidefendens]|uniref:DUF1489 family protein n=1 Tax=Cochlodiniinecator piscidefendens TaxID=2715756 RepID=UPI0014080C19